MNYPRLPFLQEPHPYQRSQKWATTLGHSIDSLPLTSVAPQRPRTGGFASRKSLKYISGAIAGKMASINRPETAGSQPSGGPSKRSSLRLLLHSPADSRKQDIGLSFTNDSSVHQPPWQMPTDEEIGGMLHNARSFIVAQQQRLEILARSRNSSSRNVSIERLDSSGDTSTKSEHSSSALDTYQKPLYQFTAYPIASPRTLQGWARPGMSTRRPLTANGVSHPLASRNSSFATLRRPHTSDGPNQEALFTSHFSRSRNGSTTSLGLPHPPRNTRTPLRQAS
jgi:hypothetical protein